MSTELMSFRTTSGAFHTLVAKFATDADGEAVFTVAITRNGEAWAEDVREMSLILPGRVVHGLHSKGAFATTAVAHGGITIPEYKGDKYEC